MSIGRDAVKHPTRHCTALTTEEYLAPGGSSTQVEISWPLEFLPPLKVNCHSFLTIDSPLITYPYLKIKSKFLFSTIYLLEK